MRKNLKNQEDSFHNGDGQTATEQPAEEGRPSPLAGTEGADFKLSPPAPPDSRDEQQPAAGRQKRAYKKRAPKTQQPAKDVVEAAPDKALVETCTQGVSAVAKMAITKLEFSDPGADWTKTMGELSARWVMRMESQWLQEHQLEAQIILHMSVWIIPNGMMLGARLMAKRNDAKRNHGSFRAEENAENQMGHTGTEE